jgi:CHASE2 domain-containing sensor protein/anti-sigma regulatory factor (Ser/Thr protein kinase)
MLPLRRRSLAEWTLLTAILALVAGMAAWQGWLWRADFLLYDTGLSLVSRPAPADIIIIAIDDESLARIGRWPWRRAIHATLLEKLTQADAAVVGLDIILSEADSNDPEGDRALAKAIRHNGHVVLPVIQRTLGPGLLAEGRPIDLFAQHAAGLGHIETQLDTDGISRSIYLWGGAGTARYPQFALAMLQIADPTLATRYARTTTDQSDDPNRSTVWTREQWLHPQFAGPPGTYRTVSYVDVLTGAVGGEELRGKRVLVGATADGLGDSLPTPMSSLGRAMPGVEIHATVLDALRSGATIDWLSRSRVVTVTVAVMLVLMLGLLFLSPRDGLVLSAAVSLTMVVGVLMLLRWGNVWLPPSAILIGASLAYPLWSWRRLEATQRFMDAELRLLHETEPGTTADKPVERSIDPLENRIAIVRAAAERQRAIQKAREDTMRFISHDIRSPLASIITLVDGAVGQAGADRHARQRQGGRYAQNALDLADDFFRLAKAEAIDTRKFAEVDLSSLAQEAADEVWPLAEEKHILILVRDEGGRDALVLGDPSLLRRALANLLNNAVKYSAADTTVRMTLRDADDWQEIAITDQGCGIAPEDLGRLFTRYGRVNRTDRPKQPGVGLGLVIVKTIIERHGGSVSVESDLGTGSTFLIRLPRTGTTA